MKRFTIRAEVGFPGYAVWDDKKDEPLIRNVARRTANVLAKTMNEVADEKKDEAIGDIGPEETPSDAREYIAKQVADGYTSGSADGENLRTAWRIVFNSWKE